LLDFNGTDLIVASCCSLFLHIWFISRIAFVLR
jgi:hypothetical protein